jgi:hypothetical protein
VDRISSFIESVEKLRDRGPTALEPVVELKCDEPGVYLTLTIPLEEFKSAYEQGRIY